MLTARLALFGQPSSGLVVRNEGINKFNKRLSTRLGGRYLHNKNESDNDCVVDTSPQCDSSTAPAAAAAAARSCD